MVQTLRFTRQASDRTARRLRFNEARETSMMISPSNFSLQTCTYPSNQFKKQPPIPFENIKCSAAPIHPSFEHDLDHPGEAINSDPFLPQVASLFGVSSREVCGPGDSDATSFLAADPSVPEGSFTFPGSSLRVFGQNPHSCTISAFHNLGQLRSFNLDAAFYSAKAIDLLPPFFHPRRLELEGRNAMDVNWILAGINAMVSRGSTNPRVTPIFRQIHNSPASGPLAKLLGTSGAPYFVSKPLSVSADVLIAAGLYSGVTSFILSSPLQSSASGHVFIVTWDPQLQIYLVLDSWSLAGPQAYPLIEFTRPILVAESYACFADDKPEWSPQDYLVADPIFPMASPEPTLEAPPTVTYDSAAAPQGFDRGPFCNDEGLSCQATIHFHGAIGRRVDNKGLSGAGAVLFRPSNGQRGFTEVHNVSRFLRVCSPAVAEAHGALLALIMADKLTSGSVTIKGFSIKLLANLASEDGRRQVNRELEIVLTPAKYLIKKMRDGGREVTLRPLQQEFNSTAIALAHNAIVNRDHQDEGRFGIVASAIGKVRSDFDFSSNTPIPAAYEAQASTPTAIVADASPATLFTPSEPLTSQQNAAWSFFHFLRENEDETANFWIHCNVKTIDTSKIPISQFRECLHVASKRASSSAQTDPYGFAEGTLLHKAIPRMLLAKVKPSTHSGVSWKQLILWRTRRFMAGHWQSLWNESEGAVIGLAQKKEMSTEMKEAAAEDRALVGDLSGATRTLQAGSLLLAEDDPQVVEEWKKKVDVPGRRPTKSWDEVARSKGKDPSSSDFTFVLGKSLVAGTDGPLEVDTLKHVMGHLPSRSAGGLDGNGFGLYATMDDAAVMPFVNSYLAAPPATSICPLDSMVRRLLVSGRGVGLDKKGSGKAEHLRPIGIGDALRRIAARCISLQTKNAQTDISLGDELQCGVGMEGGLDIGFAIPTRTLEALCAMDRPSAMILTDGGNAFQSIFQDKIIGELIESRPELVNFWRNCYGQIHAPLIFLDNGASVQVTSLFQGCGLSPEFFAQGIRGLLRDLRVEAATGSSPPTISAYLDDITCVVQLEDMFTTLENLRTLSPNYGLSFDSIEKNFYYVPAKFKKDFDTFIQSCPEDELPNIVPIVDETEGAFKRAHAELLTLERTSDPLDIARPPGCLVSFVGVQRLLGSPFRIIGSATAEADTRWLQERVEELTQPALRIFAHLGLESVDALGRSLVTNPELYITENIAKVESSQIQSLLTAYCFATKLNHLARALPPYIVVPSLKKLESMQVEVFNSIVNNSFDDSHRARVILPRRYGGCAPGVSPIAPAAYLAAAIHFENFVCEWKVRTEIGPTNPLGLFFLADRILSRSSIPRALFTETEEELMRASERINEAAVNHPHLISRTRPEVTPLNGFVQGEPLSGPAAEALLRVGGDPEAQSTPSDYRPVLFESLYTMKASQRSLANFLWVEYYNHVWVASDKISRASLDEGATKGSALFLQGIPSSAFFRFDDRNFQGQLRAFLALSPAPRKIWKHKCDNGKTLFLSDREQAMHLFHCKQQGRAIHTHGAGLEQLRDCLIAANFGHSWRLEKRLSNPEDGTSWRTDMIGVDNKNRTVLIDTTITCLSSQSNLNSRVADSQGRTLAGLKAAENRKKRDPHIQSIVKAYDALFIPFAMSTNGALGPEASKFLTRVFKHVKAAGMFSMRHSHQDTDSTWNTTWFSTFWRQRISSTVTATNAAFVNRILQRDSVFQQDGPSIAKASPYPRFYNYDPKLNRRSCNHRNPHSTRDKNS